MPIATETRQLVEQNRSRDHERYEAYRLFEEKTDITERLSLPIENHIQFELRGTQVYGFGPNGPVRMTDVAQKSYDYALADSGFDGANSIERTRRRLELDEAYAVESMVESGIDGSTMIIFSPIPDTVMRGETTLDGYRRDLARTMVRMYRFEDRELTSTTMSLEQSNKTALREVADELDMQLPADLQSEGVLATRYVRVLDRDIYETLSSRIRHSYDQSLLRQTGRNFYAGNTCATAQEAMAFVNLQNDLMHQHMQAISKIVGRIMDEKTKKNVLEIERQRTAAAIDERKQGGIVVSRNDAPVSDRMDTGNYSGECSTGSTQDQLGLSQGRYSISKVCPICGAENVFTTIYGDMISGSCGCSMEICTGDIKSRGKGKQKKQNADTHSQILRQSGKEISYLKRTQSETIRIGRELLTKKQVMCIGGTALVWVNWKGEEQSYPSLN